MAADALAASPAPAASRWAPGALPMLAWTLLFLAILAAANVAAFLHGDPGEAPPWWVWAILLLWVVPAGFSHAAYTRAKRAVVADPSLLGGWLVRNLWWVVVLALLFGPTFLGLTVL